MIKNRGQVGQGISAALCAAAMLSVAACGGTGSPSTNAGGGGGTPVIVTAMDFRFDPTTIPGQPGSMVTVSFVNAGSVTHSFTIDATGQDVIAPPGSTQTLTVTLPSSGSLSYRCKFHPQMTGAFVIGGGGAGASGSPTPAASGKGYGY